MVISEKLEKATGDFITSESALLILVRIEPISKEGAPVISALLETTTGDEISAEDKAAKELSDDSTGVPSSTARLELTSIDGDSAISALLETAIDKDEVIFNEELPISVLLKNNDDIPLEKETTTNLSEDNVGVLLSIARLVLISLVTFAVVETSIDGDITAEDETDIDLSKDNAGELLSLLRLELIVKDGEPVISVLETTTGNSEDVSTTELAEDNVVIP